MIATLGAAGMVDVQARIATIQGRMQTFAPPVVATPVATTAAAAAPVATTPSFSTALAAESSRLPVLGPSPSGAPVTAAPAAPSSAAALAPARGDWAARLPAAGQRWSGAIEQAATEAGIDPALLASLVQHESNFNPTARSHAGAIGLAQLMPGTAAGLGVNPHDPLENLRGGARYLKQQLDRFGTPELALAAYNAGPNRVAQAGGIPRISETQTYVQRVMRTWEQMR